ncbi:hypothetical protein ABIA45_000001, partial [Bradyrhizobium sp. USDA 336]
MNQLDAYLDEILAQIRREGTYKAERQVTSSQQNRIIVAG